MGYVQHGPSWKQYVVFIHLKSDEPIEPPRPSKINHLDLDQSIKVVCLPRSDGVDSIFPPL